MDLHITEADFGHLRHKRCRIPGGELYHCLTRRKTIAVLYLCRLLDTHAGSHKLDVFAVGQREHDFCKGVAQNRCPDLVRGLGQNKHIDETLPHCR